MAVLAYGLNFRTAPIEVRERLAFPPESLVMSLTELRQHIPTLTEAAIVSTCNRTELYCAIRPEDSVQIPRWFAEQRPVSFDEIQSVAYSHWDQEAASHMIRVAAGLDSQVLGEPQILGQVKTAVDTARSAGTLGPELHLLSQISFSAAKKVRTDTELGRNPVSVAYAAVSLARQIFSDLSQKNALLLGAGDTIARVAEHLRASGIGRLGIANRTLANAEALAQTYRGEPMQLTDVAENLAQYDIVIASTGSSLPVVGKGAVEAAIKQRRRKPIFMVDIAVPRDIEPEVGELGDVYLYTIDDLTEIIEENIKARRGAAEEAESLVREGVQRYVRERRAHLGQNVLREFRSQAARTQEQEVARALQALQKGDAPEEVIAQLARTLTNKLIHAPTIGIRNASADNRADLLELIKSIYQIP